MSLSPLVLFLFPVSEDCVTSSYIPVRNFEGNEPGSALLEVEEFVPCIAKCSQPFTIYNNHLYVYPKHLKYDGQKAFTKVPRLGWNNGNYTMNSCLLHFIFMFLSTYDYYSFNISSASIGADLCFPPWVLTGARPLKCNFKLHFK